MTANEEKLLRLVRESSNPEAMLASAIVIILSVIQPLPSSVVSSPADTAKRS